MCTGLCMHCFGVGIALPSTHRCNGSSYIVTPSIARTIGYPVNYVLTYIQSYAVCTDQAAWPSDDLRTNRWQVLAAINSAWGDQGV